MYSTMYSTVNVCTPQSLERLIFYLQCTQPLMYSTHHACMNKGTHAERGEAKEEFARGLPVNEEGGRDMKYKVQYA